MFEFLKKKNEGSGYFEAKSSMYQNKAGEPVAPQHHENAVNSHHAKLLINMNKTSIQPKQTTHIEASESSQGPTSENKGDNVIFSIRIDREQFQHLANASKEFTDQFGVNVQVDSDDVTCKIRICKSHLKEYIEFLEKHELTLEEEEKRIIEALLAGNHDQKPQEQQTQQQQ